MLCIPTTINNTATLPTTIPSDAYTSSHRKEDNFVKQVTVLHDGDEAVICRYYNTKQRVYCFLWVRGNGRFEASGYAGGYGYHKPSAALADALANASVTLRSSISGCGDDAANDALLAIAVAVGCDKQNLMLHIAHG